MAKKETASPAIPVFPMLKTVEQMSKISGIGENKLRELMDSGELEYIQNGNRRLIADAAIWDWYHREVKLWQYHPDKLKTNATATAY